jgi:hypothetical protein
MAARIRSVRRLAGERTGNSQTRRKVAAFSSQEPGRPAPGAARPVSLPGYAVARRLRVEPALPRIRIQAAGPF